MRVPVYSLLRLRDYGKYFFVDYHSVSELDAFWMMRMLRRRATAMVAVLWMLASMAMVCGIQMFEILVIRV